ncbi:MAG: hypothetical protein U0871_04385 [Gemmataceae bacterium]
MRLTLRTLLAYLDDTLSPGEARQIGQKVAENATARELIDRIKRVTRRRGLATPPTGGEGSPSDPNTVAEYLSDALDGEPLNEFEKTCLESDVHLAEVAACHQILTLVLSEQLRVPPTARQRMYRLVKGRESVPTRRPGNTIPVGGAREDDRPADPDDADAPLLLGMTAYSRADAPSLRLGRLAAVAALLAGFAVAVWMTLPGAEPSPVADGGGVALLKAPPPSTPPVVAEPKSGKDQPTKGSDTPTAKGTDAAPSAPPVADSTQKPVTPDEPKKEPPAVPGTPAPKTDRVPIGKAEKPNAILVRKTSAGGDWERVVAADPVVQSADRLVALPGSKPAVRLDTGVLIELWGNLPPELVPIPLYEVNLTPHLAADGFHADFQLTAGRVYLSTRQPAGAKVRVRFDAGEVWDVTLADEKSKVMAEVIPLMTPGPRPAPPTVRAGLAVVAGKAAVAARGGQPVELSKGGEVLWDGVSGRPDVRKTPPADQPLRERYTSEFPYYPDAEQAKLTLEVLDETAKKMTDPQRVRAVLDEMLQQRTDEQPTLKSAISNRVGVFAVGAVGELSKLVDALTDPQYRYVRQFAVEALRTHLAVVPADVDTFRQVLTEKRQQSAEDVDTVLELLRGPDMAGLRNPETIDRLVAGLGSQSLPVRELAYQALRGYLGPDDAGNRRLGQFDAAGPEDERTAAVKEWKQKGEAIKKRLTELPPVKQ